MSIQRKRKRYRLRKQVRLVFSILLSVVIIGCGWFVLMNLNEREYATVGFELDAVDEIAVLTQYIPEGRQNRPDLNRDFRWIVIHETDNFAKSADAQHHSDYLATNKEDVNSWH